MTCYRVTMWPGERVRVPAVAPLDRCEVHDREGVAGGPFLLLGRSRELNELPDELYLRELRNLDVTDADAMARFCERYGRLSTYYFDEIPNFERTRHPKDSPLYHRLMDLRFAHADWLRAQGEKFPYEFTAVESLEETAMYVTLVRDMTRVWQYHQGMLTFDEVVAAWENKLQFFYDASDEHTWSPQSTEDLYLFLGDHLGAALVSFHVRPLIHKEDEEENELRWGERPVTLYAALCLQLANHMAEKADYRTCKKCGTLFVRQQGRAEIGQYRTGGELFFCSKRCAHSYTQREYRKRQAANKMEGRSMT